MILGFVIINVTTINIYNTIIILTTRWSGALTLENIIINVTTINIINTTIILTTRWSGELTLENMFLAQSTKKNKNKKTKKNNHLDLDH